MWLAPRTDFSSVHGRFSISSFGTNDLAYTYFADGALQTASNSGTGSNTWTYTYNKRRMLETEVLSYDNRSFALGQGSTREEVIEAENNPSLYQWEDRKASRSHKYEKKK